MASATVGVLRVLLTANGSEFEAAMKKAQGAAQAWSKDLQSIGRQAQDVGGILTKSVSLPLIAALGGAAKAAMDFESSFANVAKTVDGVSDKAGVLTKEGNALALTFRQMAKEIPKTTDELNAIAALGGQMGVPIASLEKFTKNVAALGVAVDGISAEQAAAGLAQIANVFGDREVRNIDRMSSALVHLGNNSNATEADILEFTKRLAGAGNSVGMTIPQIMALGTAMANVGLNAEAGGTAMSTVITKISKAVSEGGSALTEFANVAGLSAEQFASVWNQSPIQAIDAFVKGLSSMKERGVDLNLTMGELGTEGIRVADTLKRLAGAGDGVARSLVTSNEGWASANKHLEEAEKKYATTANQIKLLWNQIKDVGITIGNAMLPALKSATSLISSMLPVVDVLAKAFAALPGGIQLFVFGLAGIAAAAGPAIFALGKIIESGGILVGTFTKKGTAARALSGNLTTLAGSVRGLSAALMGPAGLIALLGGAAVAFTLFKTAELKRKTEEIEDNIDAMRKASQLLGKTIGDAEEARAVLAAFESGKAGAPLKDMANATLNVAEAWKKGADAAREAASANVLAADQIGSKAFTIKGFAEQTAKATAETDKLKLVQQQIAIADKSYTEAIAGKREALTLAINAMDRTGKSVKDLSTDLGVSEHHIQRFQKELKAGAAAQKEFTKEQTAAEKAAEALTKRLEKQAAALEKLGIVTENQVLKELGELNELVNAAVDAGVPFEKVLVAIVPRLEDLRKKAKDSGVSMEVFGDSLKKADDIARKAFTQITAQLPPLINGLKQLPGVMVPISTAAEMMAQTVSDSFKFFGVRTRTELEQTARDSVLHFETIRDSGEATPEAIREAFDRMQQDLRAAGMKMKNDWTDVFDTLASAVARTFSGIVGTIAVAVLKIRDAIKIARDSSKMSTSQRVTGAGLGALDTWNSTGQEGQSTGESTISGIASGAAAGSYFGPWGTVIGGVVGGVIGYFKGRDANNQAKKANDARDEYLAQFGPGGTGPGSGFSNFAGQMHTLGPIGDALFQGVINAKTVQELEAAIAKAEKAMEQFRGELSRLNQEGGLANKTLLTFRDRTKDTAETLAFIRAETETTVSSLGSFLSVGAAAYKRLDDLRKQLKDASESDSARIQDEIKKQESLVAAIGVTSQTAATGIGAAFAAAFAELQGQHVPIRQILEQMGPAVEAFKAQLAATGFTGGEAFDYIAKLAGIAASEIGGPALEAIGSLGRALEGAHNAGFLTQEMYAGLTEQIMHSRQALIDQGNTAEDVNRLMQPQLQTIWQLQKDFGYQVDDSTQALLDEAEASGLVGDKFRSAFDRAAIAMEKAANAILKALGVVGDEAENTGKKLDHTFRDRRLKIDYDVGEVPEPTFRERIAGTGDGGGDRDYASTGAMVGAAGLRYFSGGGWARGTDTVPAMLSPGELIMNEAQQGVIANGLRQAAQVISDLFHAPSSLMDSMSAMGGMRDGPMTATVILNLDRRELGRGTAPVLPGEARRLGVRVRT